MVLKQHYLLKPIGTHIIKLNTALYNATPELMKNTLVHELIHAWQAEHEDDLGDEWHDDTFNKWCNKLNETGDFLYPLANEATPKEQNAFDKTNKSAFFVYRITKSKKIYGVFINFLYENEINISNLKAPLKKGNIVGNLTIKENKDKIKEVPLTIEKDILRMNFIEQLFRNLKDIIIGNININ